MIKIKRCCSKCGGIVRKSKARGYVFYCPSCNEDLYSIETNVITKPQTKQIFELLCRKGTLTPQEAKRFKISSLSSRICELRKAGAKIQTVLSAGKNRKIANMYVLEK